jgi:hypothetical protein
MAQAGVGDLIAYVLLGGTWGAIIGYILWKWGRE